MRSWGNPCAMSQCISTTVHLWGQNVWWKNQLLPTSSLQGNNLIPFLGRNRVGMRLVLAHTYWNTSTVCATNNGYRQWMFSCDCPLKVSSITWSIGPHSHTGTHDHHDSHSQHSQHSGQERVLTVDFIYMYLPNLGHNYILWWQLWV